MSKRISNGDVLFAEVDDIPEWMKLVDVVKDNFPGLEKESYLATLRKNIARKTALCYKDNGNITGILIFSPKQSCLSCMAVHPDYRRMGIASKLIDKMLVLLPPEKDITVTTFREGDEKGIAPRRLYKKFGFEETELLTEFGYSVQKFVLHRSENFQQLTSKWCNLSMNKVVLTGSDKEIKDITNSIAYCGLVCKLCHFADSCDGCRSENNCCGSRKTDEGCYQYNCCTKKGLNGCWECDIAPCDKGMFSASHDVRLRAFAKYIKEMGKDKLAERLYFNMQKGIYYGHGKDYDGLGSIDEVIKKLEG